MELDVSFFNDVYVLEITEEPGVGGVHHIISAL